MGGGGVDGVRRRELQNPICGVCHSDCPFSCMVVVLEVITLDSNILHNRYSLTQFQRACYIFFDERYILIKTCRCWIYQRWTIQVKVSAI